MKSQEHLANLTSALVTALIPHFAYNAYLFCLVFFRLRATKDGLLHGKAPTSLLLTSWLTVENPSI